MGGFLKHPLEVHEEGVPSLESYLRQRGVLAEKLTHGRTVAFCAAPLSVTPYFCDLGACDLAWSSHEALIGPLRTSIDSKFTELADLDLAAVAHPLCREWLGAQGVSESYIVTVEREVDPDVLQHALMFERWGYTLTDLKRLPEIRCYLDKPLRVAGFTLRVPHVDLGQLAWPLFCLFVFLMVGLGWGLSQVAWSAIETPAPTSVASEPLSPSEVVPSATDAPSTLSWQNWTWIAVYFASFLLLVTLPFFVLYRLAETLAYFLWTRTLLGIPYKRRFPYDERLG